MASSSVQHLMQYLMQHGFGFCSSHVLVEENHVRVEPEIQQWGFCVGWYEVDRLTDEVREVRSQPRVVFKYHRPR